MIVNLFSQLGGSVTTGGTWAYLGDDETAPAPPGVYNGNIDFSSTDPGEHVYEYTVTDILGCEHSSTVTVHLYDYEPQVNDTCDGAYQFPTAYAVPYARDHFGNTTAGYCPGLAPSTLSEEAIPAGWQSTDEEDFGGDLWFKVVVPAAVAGKPTDPSVISFDFVIDSLSYGATALKTPNLAIYNDECDSLELLTAGYGGTYRTQITGTHLVGTGTNFYLRVSSLAANAGYFDVYINFNFLV